jgi:hypothetical protein
MTGKIKIIRAKGILIFMIIFLYTGNLLSAPPDPASIIDNIFNYNFATASLQLNGLGTNDTFTSGTLKLEMSWWKSISETGSHRFDDFLRELHDFESEHKGSLAELISTSYRIRYNSVQGNHLVIPFLMLKIRPLLSSSETDLSGKKENVDYEMLALYRSFYDLIYNGMVFDKINPDPVKKAELEMKMENLVRSGTPEIRTMSRYFLMKYYLEVEKDKPKALQYLTDLHLQYPNNLIFSQLLTNI